MRPEGAAKCGAPTQIIYFQAPDKHHVLNCHSRRTLSATQLVYDQHTALSLYAKVDAQT